MIQSSVEHQHTQQFLAELRAFADLQCQHLEQAGLTPEDEADAMQPLLTFIAQVQDEADAYVSSGAPVG